MQITKKITFILLLSIMVNFSFAQEQGEECAFTLEKAEKLFEEGIIKEIPELLGPCLEKGFTKEEKLQAYKLIVLAYLFDDNKMEAERVMNEFLKKFPEYEILPTDPVEFVYLYESYDVFPVFNIGVYGGLNYSFVNVSEQFGTHNLNQNSLEYYTSGAGLQGGLRITRFITDAIDIDLELQIEQNKYESFDSMLSSYQVYLDERQTRFAVPISATYTFDQVKYIDPYLRLGFAPSFVISSMANPNGNYTDESQLNKADPDFSTMDIRQPFGLWMLFGGGVKYKIPRGYLILDLRYNLGLTQINESSVRLDADSPLLWKYGYLDNDFKFNDFAFTIGYSYTIYKPVKKKK